VTGRGGYGNIEEYFATVITNVYMSDKGTTELRGYYSNDSIPQETKKVMVGNEEITIAKPLPRGWSVMKDPSKFYDNVDGLSIPPRRLMQIFKDKQPDFYFALAHLPQIRPSFNPAGRHFRENLLPPKAAKAAASTGKRA